MKKNIFKITGLAIALFCVDGKCFKSGNRRVAGCKPV